MTQTEWKAIDLAHLNINSALNLLQLASNSVVNGNEELADSLLLIRGLLVSSLPLLDSSFSVKRNELMLVPSGQLLEAS